MNPEITAITVDTILPIIDMSVTPCLSMYIQYNIGMHSSCFYLHSQCAFRPEHLAGMQKKRAPATLNIFITVTGSLFSAFVI